MKVIGAGAEAVIYLDKDVIKDRIAKGYRLPDIDKRLRRSRTRREARILERLQDFPCPRLVNSDGEQRIVMQYIAGSKVRDILEKSDFRALAAEIGKKIAQMHNRGVIHGDLTTSNMILADEVYFIDFGLSVFSDKVEDKAVDLHLLRQGLESKHYTIWEECFNAAIDAYRREAKDAEAVLKRLEQVEKRGRYKRKS